MLKSLISIFQITGLQVNKAKLLIDNFSLFTFLSIELEIRLFCIDIYANDCIKKTLSWTYDICLVHFRPIINIQKSMIISEQFIHVYWDTLYIILFNNLPCGAL